MRTARFSGRLRGRVCVPGMYTTLSTPIMHTPRPAQVHAGIHPLPRGQTNMSKNLPGGKKVWNKDILDSKSIFSYFKWSNGIRIWEA